MFYTNLSVKEKKGDIYISSCVYGVKIELNSNLLTQFSKILRGDFTRTYTSHQFIVAPNTSTPLEQMRLVFRRILDDGERTIAMPFLIKCTYCIQ
jgi:hypothetical protein